MAKIYCLFLLVICNYFGSSTHLSQVHEPRCGIRNLYCASEGKSCKTCNLYDPKPWHGKTPRFSNGNIVFGNVSDIGEFPWMVSFRDAKTKTNFCSGSLLDRQHVITAAHCFIDEQKNKKNEQFKVAVGWQKTKGGKKQSFADMKRFGTNVYAIDNRKVNQWGKPVKQKGKIITHPNYQPGRNAWKVYHAHDIAIVRLQEPIKFNKRSDTNFNFPAKFYRDGSSNVFDENEVIGTFVRPICLPNRKKTLASKAIELTRWGKKYGRYERPTKIWIAGFGKKEVEGQEWKDSDGDETLELVNAEELRFSNRMFVMSNQKCKKFIQKNKPRTGKWAYGVGKGQVCAKADPAQTLAVDACQGDSGGPLAFQVDECVKKSMTMKKIEDCELARVEQTGGDPKPNKQFQLEGVVSWGIGCGNKKYPGFYTRVSHYMKFIYENTLINGESRLQYSDRV